MNRNLKRGTGYRDLGMDQEARCELSKVLPSDPDFGEAWSELGWLSDRCDIAEQDDFAEEGLAMIRNGRQERKILIQTALCLHYAGRTSEAYDLNRKFARFLTWDAIEHYGMATYASVIGNWAEAAWHLLRCLKKGGDRHIFFDLDIEHLFRHVAEEGPDRETALAFANPLFARALSLYAGKCGDIDGMLLRTVPAAFRPHLVKDPYSKLFTLSPQAPESVRKSFRIWQKTTGGRMESFARTSIARAENVILHSQLEWAADAAQRGDYFAARNHCVFALAKRPEWMDRFAQALSPLGMRYFFEDVRAPMREDPKFCNRILLLTPITAKPLDWVTEVMNSFHPLAKESALWMLSAAALENRKGDAQSNLRWQCEIMHRWPQDPAAFANAADILSRHERWEAAHYVISQTPDSFHHLRMAPTVLRWIEAQDTDAARKPGSKERFFGQPDIGGLVQGPSFWRDIFANLPGFQLLP